MASKGYNKRMKKNDVKQSYHHGNLKEALVQTALEMVDCEGIEKITLRELAQRLGTSRSAIYRHFKNKEELMKQVILGGFDRLDADLEPLFSNTSLTLLERFHAMGKAYIDFALAHPHLYRLLFGPSMSAQREEVCVDEREDLHKLLHGDSSDEVMHNGQDNGFHQLVSLIILAQEENLFKKEDPVLIATSIWSLLHGLASLAIDGHLSVVDKIEQMYEVSYKMLLQGLSL